MIKFTVTTREELSDAEKQKLEAKFRADYRDEVEVDYHTDSVLVGNMVIFDGKQEKSVVKLTVTTSVPLTEEQKRKVEATFAPKYEQEIFAEYVVDDTILGGIIVFDGKTVYDGSVKSKLDKIRETIGNGKA